MAKQKISRISIPVFSGGASPAYQARVTGSEFGAAGIGLQVRADRKDWG